MKAELILENGVRFAGELFGDIRETVGEVVFTTGMTGYQESITDPSFAGQIVTMTFPLIGNYGTNSIDMESKKASMNALVVREVCDFPSNFRCEKTLDEFLKEQGVVGLCGIDTRALTRILRNHGVMRAAIVTGDVSDEEAMTRINALDNSKVIMQTTTKQKYVYNEGGRLHIAFIDMGAKQNIIRDLAARDAKLTVFPADVKSDEILAENPDLVFVSNGPGDPLDAPGTVDTIKALLGKLPIYGICMGHQIIGLALGGRTEKLKFGHHGGNHPVKDSKTGRVFITSQNHNYIIADLPQNVEVTFTNVNDGTCEGIRCRELNVESVQFHPEAAPGPLDTGFLFDRFLGKED